MRKGLHLQYEVKVLKQSIPGLHAFECIISASPPKNHRLFFYSLQAETKMEVSNLLEESHSLKMKI